MFAFFVDHKSINCWRFTKLWPFKVKRFKLTYYKRLTKKPYFQYELVILVMQVFSTNQSKLRLGHFSQETQYLPIFDQDLTRHLEILNYIQLFLRGQTESQIAQLFYYFFLQFNLLFYHVDDNIMQLQNLLVQYKEVNTKKSLVSPQES